MPGEIIPFQAEIDNKADQDMQGSSLQLIEHITYFAGWDLKNGPPDVLEYVKGWILFLATCRISKIIVFRLFLAMAFHLKLI